MNHFKELTADNCGAFSNSATFAFVGCKDGHAWIFLRRLLRGRVAAKGHRCDGKYAEVGKCGREQSFCAFHEGFSGLVEAPISIAHGDGVCTKDMRIVSE